MKNESITSLNRALLVLVIAVLAGCASKAPLPPDSAPEKPSPPSVAIEAIPPEVAPPAPTRAPPTVTAAAAAPAPKIRMPNILFDTGSSALRDSAKSDLNKFAEFFKNKGLIFVTGHTDSSKDNQSSDNLSIKRADAVKSYLQSIGVESRRIYLFSQGKDQPAANNKTAEGRALNNRVEILIDRTETALPWKAEDQIPVLFATNRQRTGKDSPLDFYNNNLNGKKDFQRGLAVIKVPSHHVRGKVERPSFLMITLENFTKTELAKSLNIPEVTAEDLNTHFSYVDKIKELDKPVFDTELVKAIKKSKSKTAVLYVHGYANNFNDAIFRTAQIVHDLETPEYDLVPLMFSWPSDPGMTKMNYIEAGTKDRLEKSSTALKNFLKEIKDNTDIGTVHIIAHSMGARVLGQAIKDLNTEMGIKESDTSIKPVFRQIIFAAPDIDVKTFNEYIEPAIKSNHPVTTYGAKSDIALWFSSIINGKPRQGQLSFDMVKDCVDKIDVTAVGKEGDFLKHSTWAESRHVLNDLRFVLRDGLQPLSRGLTPRDKDKLGWVLRAIGTENIKPVTSTPVASGCSR